jgi:site-specific DNA recombinase
LLDGVAPVPEDDGIRLPLIITAVPDQRGRNLKLMLESSDEQKPSVNLDLLAMIRKAEAARQRLFADPSGADDRAAERLARLAFLGPDIIVAILDGRLPPSPTPRRLIKHAAIPLDWKAQRKAIGFE